ncbi:hypothetical protein MAR_038010, partial [Mya arenaria]
PQEGFSKDDDEGDEEEIVVEDFPFIHQSIGRPAKVKNPLPTKIVFVENYLAGKSLKFTWTKKDVAEKRKYIGSLLAARSVTDLNSTDEQVADWQRDNADNGQEIISPEEDTNSNNEGVERMSSFYYPQNRPLKKTKTDVLCVCEHPNEGNNWHCDICKQQFHHGCFKKDVVHTDGGVSICPNCDKEVKIIYLEYVFNLLAKEACDLLLSNILTLNYDIVDQECRKTETTKRQFLS